MTAITIKVRERVLNGIECWAAELWIGGVCFFTTTHLGKDHAMQLAFNVCRDLGLPVETIGELQ